MKIKIPLHSTTDLITNSSTVIFTYSENSVGALKEMIDELFKTFGIEKTCEDVFDTVITCEDSWPYEEYARENEIEGVNIDEIDQLLKDVTAGKTPKPEWFNDAEKTESCCDYYTPTTILSLIPKSAEYERLGSLVENFLYSPNHEATRDG
jgi:hypothetical protein